jgi:hypothetical protein
MALVAGKVAIDLRHDVIRIETYPSEVVPSAPSVSPTPAKRFSIDGHEKWNGDRIARIEYSQRLRCVYGRLRWKRGLGKSIIAS